MAEATRSRTLSSSSAAAAQQHPSIVTQPPSSPNTPTKPTSAAAASSTRRNSGQSQGSGSPRTTPKARNPSLPSSSSSSKPQPKLRIPQVESGTSTEADDTDNEALMSTTTITTLSIGKSGAKTGKQSTLEVTHSGATGVKHEVGPDGTVSLHPIGEGAAKRKVKVKKVVTFQPRWSKFDRQNLAAHTDPFRGFYVLFWILLGVGALRTFYVSYEESGLIPGLSFGSLISRDGRVLALSDAVLIASTFLCVPFIKLVKNRWIGRIGALSIQHIGQAAFVGIAVRWTFYRSWPWVQSGYMVLHAIAMLMKIHSYTAYNMELAEKSHSFEKFISQLRRTLAPGSIGETEAPSQAAVKSALETALEAAHDARARKEAEGQAAASTNGNGHSHHSDQSDVELKGHSRPPSGAATPRSEVSSIAPSVASSSLNPESASHNVRHRALSGSRTGPSTAALTSADATAAINSSLVDEKPQSADLLRTRDCLTTLAHHPDEQIASLAGQAADLDEDLTSTGPAEVRWPQNVTYRNFWDYLLVPTLVYELEYPRTNRIRPLYVIEKILATFGTFSLLLMCTEYYILPNTPQKGDPFALNMLNLCVPFMVNYLLIFYIIFECICNAFAELTCFADREFYSDWWNSTSFDEFSRRWNKPVHMFLLRHVYSATVSTFRISKLQASFVTFLLSACFHELVMVVVTKKIRPYLFLMQMAQLPLIMIGRHPFFRKNPTIGNMFFWIGLMTGFPLLAVSYLTM